MAVQLSPEDFALFDAHLAKVERHPKCPVCDSDDWEVVGLETAQGVGTRNQVELYLQPFHPGAPMMPVVVAVCMNCFYVRQWAWIPIKFPERWASRATRRAKQNG